MLLRRLGFFIISILLPVLVHPAVCRVNSVDGSAFLKRGRAEQALVKGIQIVSGDEVRVAKGKVTIACADKSIIVLHTHTTVTTRENATTSEPAFNFISPSYPSRYWDVKNGRVVARVYSAHDVKSATLFTSGDVVVTAKGTDLSLQVSNNGTTVSAIRGVVAGANIERTLTFTLPQRVLGLFKSSPGNFLYTKSVRGDFNVQSRESISSFESGESAYLRTERDTGLTTCRAAPDSPGAIVMTSGETKVICGPGQEMSLDLTEENTVVAVAGEENREEIPAKVSFCGTRLFVKPGARSTVQANPTLRTVRVTSHTGRVRVEASDGRVVYLEGNQSFTDNCGIPVAEVVPPLETPASPIKPQ